MKDGEPQVSDFVKKGDLTMNRKLQRYCWRILCKVFPPLLNVRERQNLGIIG